LFKKAHELKIYLWHKLKLDKTQNLSKVTIDKQVGSSVPRVGTTIVTIDNHMAIIQCRNPTLAKCGGEAQHLESLRIWSPPGLPNV
jgi:hypothetical protein